MIIIHIVIKFFINIFIVLGYFHIFYIGKMAKKNCATGWVVTHSRHVNLLDSKTFWTVVLMRR